MKVFRKENRSGFSDVEKFTDDTLEYLKSRGPLWASQQSDKVKKEIIVDFSPENLSQFYQDENHLQLKKEFKTNQDWSSSEEDET